ncbi:MAG TPA: hypothetical protein VEI58_06080, partial [Chthoniobacterales bacterium]|nr:hypothetical protein [Chthoniobacterales bacterium]
LGKFFIFSAAVSQHQVTLVLVGIITVACGFYYYLKVVRAMYWQPATNAGTISTSILSRAMIGMLIIAIVWLGIYPQPILRALAGQNPSLVVAKAISTR